MDAGHRNEHLFVLLHVQDKWSVIYAMVNRSIFSKRFQQRHQKMLSNLYKEWMKR